MAPRPVREGPCALPLPLRGCIHACPPTLEAVRSPTPTRAWLGNEPSCSPLTVPPTFGEREPFGRGWGFRMGLLCICVTRFGYPIITNVSFRFDRGAGCVSIGGHVGLASGRTRPSCTYRMDASPRRSRDLLIARPPQS